MDLKHLPSIVDDDNKEEDDRLMVEEKSKSEAESESDEGIHHPSHPNHPLYLHDDTSAGVCGFCGYLMGRWSYQCDKEGCDFKLHLECASVMPSIKHEEHNHLLALIEGCDEKRACQNCRCDLNSFYARCFECDIDYHFQCDRQGLPGTTIYEFHDHPLFLTYKNDEVKFKFCFACEREINPKPNHYSGKKFPLYSCKECGYSCHVRCVISEIKLDKRVKLDHSIHKHVLFLSDEDDKDEASCCVCGNFVCAADETTFTYCCSQCSFYIHKSCIPVLEVTHEFHPHHPLKVYWQNDGFSCDACNIKISGFTYRCDTCDFDIGLECACISKVQSIPDERHEHLLTFFNKMHHLKTCIMECGLRSPDAAFLRCVQCNFNVHLVCSPLPRDIKFKGHLHKLALKDYHIEDDFGEYYCDHCEGPRDPKECAYHCAEGCPYVAEFNCVVDEVVRSLSEKHHEVGFLRTVNRLAADEYYYKNVSKGLFLHDVYKSSPEEELELEVIQTTTQRHWDSDNILENCFMGDMLSIVEVARENLWDLCISKDLKSKVVKIGNYIITKDLQTLFSEIHRKYSNIGDNCTLSEGSKAIVLIQFVQVIHEMIETRISKITKEVFSSWLFRMLFVGNAGFKVDFVLKHMDEIYMAHHSLHMCINCLPEVKDYYKEMEVITDEIEVQKAKLVKLKEKEKESIELLFDIKMRETRYEILDKIDFNFETAGKRLL